MDRTILILTCGALALWAAGDAGAVSTDAAPDVYVCYWHDPSTGDWGVDVQHSYCDGVCVSLDPFGCLFGGKWI